MRLFRITFFDHARQPTATYTFDAENDAMAIAVATAFRGEIPGWAMAEIWDGTRQVHCRALPLSKPRLA